MVSANAMSNPVQFAAEALKMAFGAGTPRDQMIWSVILAGLAYVLTIFSLGATALLVILFTITFLVGLARAIVGLVTG